MVNVEELTLTEKWELIKALLLKNPVGEWEESRDDETFGRYQCPICAHTQTLQSNYCPCCGARLRR